MSKLPTYGISFKNNLKLQTPSKIGGLKYSTKPKSSFSTKDEINRRINSSKNININDYVFIKTTNQKGTVRYIGETKFKTGIWVGVELDKRGVGKNNGTVMGVTYFKCPPLTGIFIPVTAVEKLSGDQGNDIVSEVSTISTKKI
ncbi:hypothetical protein H8356DRAFT_912565, partial [Neocallimastix lanati (nom. inval.)]